MIRLHGLTIDDRPGDTRDVQADADLRWIRRIAPAPAPIDDSAAWLESRDDGVWTHQRFARGEGTHVHFAISADGRLVESVAEPQVPDVALIDLMSETLMRSIFRHRGIVSFHAAVLARAGRAIAILGERGAGKSSLSVALTGHGWRLVADDLARIMPGDGMCLAFPGFTQAKVHEDVAAALRLPAERLARRWTPPVARPIPRAVDKLLYACPAHQGGPVALDAIYLLSPRDPAIEAPRVTPIPPVERITQLLRHLTRDAAMPDAEPAPEAAATVLRVAGSVPVLGATLPDDLSRLAVSAGLFSALA
jgi:hypothetical protein